MDENTIVTPQLPEAAPQAAAEPLTEAAAPVIEHEEKAVPQQVLVVGVRFKQGGKIYFFDPAGQDYQPGQDVIIDTARGVEYGECAEEAHMVPVSRVVQPLRRVVRAATEADRAVLLANAEKEARAFDVCQKKILDHGLDMKLVRVEYSFDGGKILFFFTSDGRVDFRELVKSLASVFRTRIELRQIGVRDEAKMLGGLGICGRPFCCSSFLEDFQPVSIKMAKTQGLSLNPTKISGTCGRLMCCLKHEQDAYEALIKTTPKLDSLVDTPEGRGTVTTVSLLKQQCKVRLTEDPDSNKYYCNCDLCVLRNGKAKPGGKQDDEFPPFQPRAPKPQQETAEHAEVYSPKGSYSALEGLPGESKRSELAQSRPAGEGGEGARPQQGQQRRRSGRGGASKDGSPRENNRDNATREGSRDSAPRDGAKDSAQAASAKDGGQSSRRGGRSGQPGTQQKPRQRQEQKPADKQQTGSQQPAQAAGQSAEGGEASKPRRSGYRRNRYRGKKPPEGKTE